MKKIFTFILIVTTLCLIGCSEPVYTENDNVEYNDTELREEIQSLQEQIDNITVSDNNNLLEQLLELESRIATLEQKMSSMSVVTGLNGQQTIYYQKEKQTLHTLGNTVSKLKQTFDITKNIPNYMIDENGDYISFERLMLLLKDKYLYDVAIPMELDYSYDKFSLKETNYARIRYSNTLSNEEMLARAILMIEELRLYEVYLISTTGLDVHMINDYDGNLEQTFIYIPQFTMINECFDITPSGILNGDYEMQLIVDNYEYDSDLVEIYYNDFVTNQTFEGYVLNYENSITQ